MKIKICKPQYIVFLIIISLFLSSCHFQTPGAKVIGVYGVSDRYSSSVGINLIVVGLRVGLGGNIGLGFAGTSLMVG